MGGEPYWYFVPYQDDVQRALDVLRRTEFEAGRYSPVIELPDFSDPGFRLQTPGPGHSSIQEAVAAAGEDGTRSILDIGRVGTRSAVGVCSQLDLETIEELYGTSQPTPTMVARNLGFLTAVGRGECVYLVLFDDGRPVEICFAGYSYD